MTPDLEWFVFLDRLKVKTKVRLPIWILACFTLVVAVHGLFKLQAMIEYGHSEKARSQVESAISIAQVNYDRFKKGDLTEEDAQTRARDAIRAMVFNGGDRVFAFDSKGIRIVSSAPYPEGSSAWRSRQTRSMIQNALDGGGVTYFEGVRTVDGVASGPLPIAAWSAHFAPWDWVVASAVFLDDVTHSVKGSAGELAIFLGSCGLLVILITNMISRSITRPLISLTGNMKQLANSDTNVRISGLGRKDEIGEMAVAMETFVSHEVQRQLLQEQLTDLAYTDSLTGLANRTQFYKTLQKVTERAHLTDQKCALMVLDIDRFKSINDSIGHFFGDLVLKGFAQKILGVVGDQGVAGRLGGDEFFVILPDCGSSEEAVKLAVAILASTVEPLKVQGHEIPVSTSIGIASGPDDGTSETRLFQCADMAMYEAKIQGGGRVLRYTDAMGQRAIEQYEMEERIIKGLAKGQFFAHFQAKYDLKTGKMVGAEALCRWDSPEHGTISPREFIPIAEKSGQIDKIGALMLSQACQMALDCNRVSDAPFVIAVNVSAKQLQYGSFLEELRRCLTQTGCQPSWIEIEITESLLLNDDDQVLALLDAISQLGVTIAIDDFGTGYSAMSYLTRFPIKCLKVDQSFVREMDLDKQKQVLVASMLAMAKGLGLKTVAEGVETETVAEMLAELNCDVGQGYLWHTPSSAASLVAILERQDV